MAVFTNGFESIHSKNGSLSKKVKLEEVDFTPSKNTYSYESLLETANYLLERTYHMSPSIGIICGSGLGSLANSLEDKVCFPYESIPNFPLSTVEGHVGQLVFGYLNNIPVVCMQGRFHYYEGYPLSMCCMPVQVMKLLGVTHLIATNAAGSLNQNFKVGDIMLIKDHINLMGFAGNNPLRGPNDDRLGPRFFPMNRAYDRELIQSAKEIGKELNMQDMIHDGVYTCLGGPNFETVAELKMLKMIGVDAVGMSTVHEVITARHCDMTVFAFSLITNLCTVDYDSHAEANHEEVMDVGKLAQASLAKFVARVVKHIQMDIKK